MNRIQKRVSKNKSIKLDFRFQTWVCQNVSNEVLLASFKFQAKIPSHSGVCVQGEWKKNTTFPPLHSLRDIGHSMSIGNLILDVNSVTVSYLILYDSLLQNATDIITNCDSYFITKCNRSLLQNASGFLLQNATVLLQNVTVITNCDDFITWCDSYYKMRRLLKIATLHISLYCKDMVKLYYIKGVWKQPFADVLQIKCSWKFCKIHGKTPVLESLFNKVAGLKRLHPSVFLWFLRDFQEYLIIKPVIK